MSRSDYEDVNAEINLKSAFNKTQTNTNKIQIRLRFVLKSGRFWKVDTVIRAKLLTQMSHAQANNTMYQNILISMHHLSLPSEFQ